MVGIMSRSCWDGRGHSDGLHGVLWGVILDALLT